jgi:hypothetical protein
MYLDETDLAQTGLKTESGNLLIYLQKIENFASPFGGSSWWTGGGADQFFNSINACVNDIKDFALEIVNFYDRIALEEEEWAEVDLSFRFSPDALKASDLPTADFLKGNLLPGSAKPKFGLEYKHSLKDQLGPSAPWQFRYPADPDVKKYQGWFGNTITETTTYGDWDGGRKTSLDGDGLAFGYYAEGKAYKKKYASALLGIPMALAFHGPAYGADAGSGGVSGKAALGGVDLNFAGLSVGIDAGWGWGSDGKSFRFGPFSIGLDLGVYDGTSAPTRPPF